MSDGTTEGTEPLHDPNSTEDGQLWIEPGGVAAWGDHLAFIGDDGVSGEEPWLSDGTEGGTHILADVWPGPMESSVSRFTAAGGDLYFTANDGVHGTEPWKAQGSAVGMLADIQTGAGSSYSGDLTAFGERLAFVAQDSVGSGLWLSDDSGLVKLHPDAWGGVVGLGDHILFSGFDAAGGEELWRTDGVATSRVIDLRPGSLGSSPSWLTRVGTSVYFQAFSGSGFRLWKTDGTEVGTTQVAGWDGPGAVYPLVAVGDRLFFFEEAPPATPTSPARLWVAADGIAMFLKEIEASPVLSYPADGLVQSCGGLLYFVADDGAHGSELWRSDGTPEGTMMVHDVRPGSVGSEPSALTAVGGSLYFQANDGVTGEELWVTDGTSEGTRLVHDVVTGSGGSAPGQLVLVNRQLFFSAQTAQTGREPHVLDVGADLDYHSWTQASDLSGISAAAGSTPWNDGVPNLLKYAFGIAGGQPYQRGALGELGELPLVQALGAEDGRLLRIEFVRRIDGGLTYTAMRSATLEAGSFLPMAGVESVYPVDAEWERVVIEELVTLDRCFAVVQVSLR